MRHPPYLALLERWYCRAVESRSATFRVEASPRTPAGAHPVTARAARQTRWATATTSPPEAAGISNRIVSATPSGGEAKRQPSAALAASARAAARAIRTSCRAVRRTLASSAVMFDARTPPWITHFSSCSTSRAVCQRSSGSFARHVATTWSSAAGVSGCARGHRRRRVLQDRADHARRRVALERARRRSASRRAPRPAPRCRCARRPPSPPPAPAPCTAPCPTIVPCAGAGRSSWPAASIPDSEIGPPAPAASPARSPAASRPAFVSMMFAGLRSRWTMPARCALSSASAISMAKRQRLVERQRALAPDAPPASRPRGAPCTR